MFVHTPIILTIGVMHLGNLKPKGINNFSACALSKVVLLNVLEKGLSNTNKPWFVTHCTKNK